MTNIVGSIAFFCCYLAPYFSAVAIWVCLNWTRIPMSGNQENHFWALGPCDWKMLPFFRTKEKQLQWIIFFGGPMDMFHPFRTPDFHAAMLNICSSKKRAFNTYIVLLPWKWSSNWNPSCIRWTNLRMVSQSSFIDGELALLSFHLKSFCRGLALTCSFNVLRLKTFKLPKCTHVLLAIRIAPMFVGGQR